MPVRKGRAGATEMSVDVVAIDHAVGAWRATFVAASTLAFRHPTLVLVGRDQVVLGLGDALKACWEEWLQRVDLLPSGQRGVAVGVGDVLRHGGGRVRGDVAG